MLPRVALAFALALAGSTLARAAPTQAPAPAPVGAVAPIDRLVAVASGVPIWESAVDEVLRGAPAADTPTGRKAQREEMVEQLIDQALILRVARSLHVEALDSELDAALAAVKAQNHLDDAAFAAALDQYGMTMPRYREVLRRQVLELRTFNQVVRPAAELTPEQRDAAFKAWTADLRRVARVERR